MSDTMPSCLILTEHANVKGDDRHLWLRSLRNALAPRFSVSVCAASAGPLPHAAPVAALWRRVRLSLAMKNAPVDPAIVVLDDFGLLGLLPALRERFPEARIVALVSGADVAKYRNDHPRAAYHVAFAERLLARVAPDHCVCLSQSAWETAMALELPSPVRIDPAPDRALDLRTELGDDLAVVVPYDCDRTRGIASFLEEVAPRLPPRYRIVCVGQKRRFRPSGAIGQSAALWMERSIGEDDILTMAARARLLFVPQPDSDLSPSSPFALSARLSGAVVAMIREAGNVDSCIDGHGMRGFRPEETDLMVAWIHDALSWSNVKRRTSLEGETDLRAEIGRRQRAIADLFAGFLG